MIDSITPQMCQKLHDYKKLEFGNFMVDHESDWLVLKEIPKDIQKTIANTLRMELPGSRQTLSQYPEHWVNFFLMFHDHYFS